MWDAIRYGRYEPDYSKCFIRKKPVLREIFASAYVDRVIQHWADLRLDPILEERFQAQGKDVYKRQGDSSYMIYFNPADKDNSDQDKSWLYGLYEMKQNGFNYSTNAFVTDKNEGKAFKVSDDATALCTYRPYNLSLIHI